MQDLSDEDRKSVLGEVLMDELKIIREYLEQLLPLNKKVDSLDKDMSEVKADIKVIKAVVTDHSQQLSDHEVRVTRLEAAI